MNKLSDFVYFLLEEMEERGWSQADLARAANVSRTAISDVINEKRSAGPELCTAIAKAFDYPPETVFRKAGLLPSLNKGDETTEQAVHIFNQLSPHYQEIALDLLRSLSKQQTNKEENPGEVSPATHKA